MCGFVLALIYLALFTYAYGQPVVFNEPSADPALEWRTIETEHFSIIYPTALEELAQEVARLTERAYQFWSEALTYQPAAKTYLVLSDSRDTRSVSVAVFPYNLIVLSHPTGLPATPEEDAPWDLEGLLRLLYGQIAVEDQTLGLAAELRGVIGKLASPGLFKPLWLRRGLPAALAQGGDEPLTKMALFAFARSGRWPTLAALSAPSESAAWPPVESAARAVGAAFLRYLAETYGRDFIVEISRSYATRPLRALADDGPLRELYREFQARVEELAARQALELEAQGGTSPRTRLSSLGFFNEAPAWSPDGTRLVYLHRDSQRAPGLREISRRDGNDRAILACECGPPIWLNDETLIYPKLTSIDAYRRYFDLYRYDLDTKQEERLTYGERIYALAPFPDGRRLLVARNERGGGSSLAVVDLDRNTRRVLWKFGLERRVHSLAASPRGDYFAISLWTRGAGVDLYLIENTDEGRTPERWRPITQDPALDLSPTFSPDGEYVLFSSNRSGRFEIYAVRLSDGALFQVTRSPLGSFAPAISPDGRTIAFVGYNEGGFYIYETPYEPARWTPVPRPTGAAAAASPPQPATTADRLHFDRYDPAPALLPTYWLPLVSRGHVGLLTGNADPLRWHSYQLTLGVGLEPFELFSEALYRNTRLAVPRLAVDLTISPLRQRQRIALEFPFGRSPSAPRSLIAELSHEPGTSTLTLKGRLLNLRGFDLFQRRSTLTVQGDLAWLIDRGLIRRLAFDWEERIRLPVESEAGPHQLVFRVRTAWSDRGEFSLGGLRGEFPLLGFPERSVPSQILTVRAEYRFPLWAPAPLGPLSLDVLRGRLLINAGTGGAPLDLLQTKIGFGMELQAKLVFGYGLAESWLRLGWAYGLGERDPQFYAAISREF